MFTLMALRKMPIWIPAGRRRRVRDSAQPDCRRFDRSHRIGASGEWMYLFKPQDPFVGTGTSNAAAGRSAPQQRRSLQLITEDFGMGEQRDQESDASICVPGRSVAHGYHHIAGVEAVLDLAEDLRRRRSSAAGGSAIAQQDNQGSRAAEEIAGSRAAVHRWQARPRLYQPARENSSRVGNSRSTDLVSTKRVLPTMTFEPPKIAISSLRSAYAPDCRHRSEIEDCVRSASGSI